MGLYLLVSAFEHKRAMEQAQAIAANGGKLAQLAHLIHQGSAS
jgi:hypothetical protein